MDFKGAKQYIINRLQNELDHGLFYHGLHHTLDVYESTERLAALEKISGKDLILLKTAALYHDSGFIEQSNDHEEASIGIARNILPAFHYSQQEIESVCGMILATKLPQSPQNHLEEILCDADLDYLGRADFPAISAMLLKEFLSRHIIKDAKDWNKFQVKFFKSHTYFTHSAQQLRAAKKQEWLESLEHADGN